MDATLRRLWPWMVVPLCALAWHATRRSSLPVDGDVGRPQLAALAPAPALEPRPSPTVTRRAGVREVAGVKMPEAVDIADRTLWLNGMGLRKEKVFFKVYVIGLYLETPTRDARAAITTNGAKRVVIVMLRDADRAAFVDAVETGIERNSGPMMPFLRKRLDRLEEALPELKKGNVLDFTYVPGVGTLVRAQGREMAISGKDFADALFSVWLGANPIDRGLKNKLLPAQ